MSRLSLDGLKVSVARRTAAIAWSAPATFSAGLFRTIDVVLGFAGFRGSRMVRRRLRVRSRSTRFIEHAICRSDLIILPTLPLRCGPSILICHYISPDAWKILHGGDRSS
jgi:hypothetical protein